MLVCLVVSGGVGALWMIDSGVIYNSAVTSIRKPERRIHELLSLQLLLSFSEGGLSEKVSRTIVGFTQKSVMQHIRFIFQ